MFPRGRVAHVRGVEAATRLAGVIDAVVERAPGELIGEVHDGRNRPGHVLVRGEHPAVVQQTLAAVRALIRVDYEHAAGVAPLDLVTCGGSAS
jgi:hypothetical protein